MRDPASVRAFLLSEIEALESFDFVSIQPSERPLHRVEIGRNEDDSLELRLPGRLPIVPPLQPEVTRALDERGFTSQNASDSTEPWVHAVEDATRATDLAEDILYEVFKEKRGVTLDILHGSHRAAHEARQKLAAVRERVEHVIIDVIGGQPEKDADEDYLLPIGDVQVTVAPRVVPGGPAIVRVFAVTNVGVAVVPELGLFLARLNFGLMFGRFALDTERKSIWFDETLLGDQLNEEALKFAIKVVATTADEWDDRLKEMFGGMKFREAASEDRLRDVAASKPGVQPQDGRGLYL